LQELHMKIDSTYARGVYVGNLARFLQRGEVSRHTPDGYLARLMRGGRRRVLR